MPDNRYENLALSALRHHVSGAVARGEAESIAAVAIDEPASPMTLDVWLSQPPAYPYERAPYDRPCPACGESMTYPTSCTCAFERRVAALAGMLVWSVRARAYYPAFDAWTRESVRAVNAAMRALDDSSSWPIRGRFNATDRAIRRVRAASNDDDLYSYVLSVDREISRIVNAF